MNHLAYEYFLETAKRGSLVKAAEHLYVSQPALSRQINHLESEIGFALFFREPRGLRLTPGGTIFLRECEKMRQQYEQMLAEAKNANEGKIGFVRIGIQEGHDVDALLIHVIRTFQKEHPNIDIEVVCLSHRLIFEWLSLNQLDVGIAISFNSENEYIHFSHRILRQRQSYVILNHKHRLATAADLDYSELNKETLLVTCPDVATDGVEFVKNTCNRFNIHPKNTKLAPSYSTLYIWLSMNEGFTISDENAWFENKKLKYFALPPTGNSLQVAYWAKNNYSSCTKLFLDFLDDYFSKSEK